MDLRQLRQFSVLAENLTFHAAAERLHMAQPPLSVSIRKLEEELGVTLFERSRRGVVLTEAGRAVLADARKALFYADEVTRNASAAVHGMGGRLRIGFVGSAKYRLLPALLPLFRAQHTEVMLELHEGSNAAIINAIEQRSMDIGIVRVPLQSAHTLKFEIVETDVLVAAIPRGHALAAQPTVSLSDLAAEPFIHYAADAVPGLHALTMMLFQSVGESPHAAQWAVQVETVICLVESGLGVALVPSCCQRRKSDLCTFREISPTSDLARIGLAVAYDAEAEPAAARRFRSMAKQFGIWRPDRPEP